MESSERSDALDLDRGLRTTAEDGEALRRAACIRVLDIEQYLAFLDQLPTPAADALRARKGPRGARPFTLV